MRTYQPSGLGRSIVGFFQEYLPSLRGMSRHTIQSYRDGADVQSNLPRLAIYMGHVSIVSTAHYLHFVPTMRQLASDRFEIAFGDVVKEVSA